MQERRYTVQSIHCGGCERAIREGFRHVEGVAEVAPDARTNTVEVRFDPTAIDDEPVRDRLTTLGFAPVDDHEQAPGDRQRLARYLLLAVAVAAVAVAGYTGYVLYPRFDLPAVEGAAVLGLAAAAGVASFFSALLPYPWAPNHIDASSTPPPA